MFLKKIRPLKAIPINREDNQLDPDNLGLLMSLAHWRDYEYKYGSFKKAKNIQKSIRNIMATKNAYRKSKSGH
ncbi:hypothetical protein [Alkaliphilus metalliredigens]|nr:hypothetical protein [Alkaliphilus metalliredigens]